jgi:hypothetical protein
MAVVFDSIGTAAATALNQTSVDFTNITIGAGANPALLLLVRFDGTAAPTGISFVWDFGGTPQTFSLIGQVQVTNLGANFTTLQLWGYAGPIPNRGNRVLHGAWTNGQDYTVDAICFTGVDQTGNAFYNFTTASGSSATPTITLAGTTSDQVVALFGEAGGRDFTAVNNNTIFLAFTSAGNYAAGAASVAMSATTTASHLWSAIGVSVRQPSTTWQGNSRLAGVGTLSADTQKATNPSAARLVGVGSLSVNVAQRATNPSAGSLVGAGGLSSDTTQTYALVAGDHTVTVAPPSPLPAFDAVTLVNSAILTGAGGLSAGTLPTSRDISARFAHSGSLSAFGSIPGQIAQGVGYGLGAGKLSAFAGVQYTIAASLKGAGTLATVVGKQLGITATFAGAANFLAKTNFDLFPVVTHFNPVPVGSSNYDPTLSPEENNARLIMITSNLNDAHAMNMPSGAILGRGDVGFGPVQGLRLTSPLRLTADGEVQVDIVALRALLGL